MLTERVKDSPIPSRTPTNKEAEKVQLMVMLERPPSEHFKHFDRGEKYRVLMDRAAHQRTQLMEWIAQHGLSGECMRVKEPTAFNVLFIEGTPALAEALRRAPNVVCVARIGDLMLELLDAPHG